MEGLDLSCHIGKTMDSSSLSSFAAGLCVSFLALRPFSNEDSLCLTSTDSPLSMRITKPH